jgi:SsrA-binding protein
VAVEKPTRVQVATNRRARYDYEIEDELEAGMVLTGTEVKSLRDGKAELQDGYAEIEHGELFLNQVHIPEYRQGNVFNHEPRRRRKLLAHREQIDRLHRKVTEKGYTLVPLELYFSSGRAKVKLGLARGKKKYDKRESVKARDVRRELERE